MRGRYQRLPGSLLRNMNSLVKANETDSTSKNDDRPNTINYERMLGGYDKLGHMKKLSVPFDMSKTKSRDMSILMQTEAFKNILYDNYRQQFEEKNVPSYVQNHGSSSFN